MPSIIKRGGGRCEYDQKKLRASMMLALRKRPVSRERVDEAINRIEQKMLALGEREVRSDRLGELVMEELRKLIARLLNRLVKSAFCERVCNIIHTVIYNFDSIF